MRACPSSRSIQAVASARLSNSRMVWCAVTAVSGLGLAGRVVPPAHGGRFTESGKMKMGGDVRRAIQLVKDRRGWRVGAMGRRTWQREVRISHTLRLAVRANWASKPSHGVIKVSRLGLHSSARIEKVLYSDFYTHPRRESGVSIVWL